MDKGQFLLYQTPDGESKIEVKLQDDTVWLSLDQMAELFQRDKSTISRHIRNIFAEGELDREAVVAKFATTASDGKTYQVDFYNLDVIISVGYRVRSLRGTQFRIWANSVLKDYLIKGFAMNDDPYYTSDEYKAGQIRGERGVMSGIPDWYVGECVFTAVEDEKFYIFTHPESQVVAQPRVQRLASGINPQT